jgi:mono/diheme cytochrome c family protein
MKIVCRISAILLCTIAVACASAEQRAASVYKTNCAQCHGTVGDANTAAGKKFSVPPFHGADAFKKTDAELLEFIKAGKGDMPAWSDILSDDEVKAVIGYIRTLEKSGSGGDNSTVRAEGLDKSK